MAIFDSATSYVLGNSERAWFWTDRWLEGQRVADFAPNMVKMVSNRRLKACSVKEGSIGQ
jgi:hypothetical protein